MRITAVGFLFVMVCGAAFAQKVHFTPASSAEILDKVKDAPATDAERASRIKALFADAGCNGALLREQAVTGSAAPNVICQLRGEDNEAVIVGAHYETASTGRPLDN